MNADATHSVPPSSTDPTRRPLPAAPLDIPKTIGKYQVLERLGSGAMGVVYKCSQPGLDRPVAVKVLLAAVHANPEQLLRFQREGRAAGRLTHANVVQIYDVGCENGLHYFVMEYVDGWPLDRLIGKPSLTLFKTLRIVYHVARALQAAHDQGVVHRDVKPSNILVQRSGVPKLSDFGLAKLLADNRALSGSGDLIGTPRYMAPEQALSEPSEVDGQSDVYSLGAVMYEMLTGRPPVDGPNALAILCKLSEEDPPPVRQRNPEIPEPVAAICHRALARDKQRRFATAGQFADAVQAYLLEQMRGQSPPSTPSAARLPAPKPAAVSAPRSRLRRWLALTLAFLAAGLLGGTLLAFLWRPARTPTGPKPDLSKLVERAREELSAPLQVPETTTARDRLRSLLEDLSVVLKYDPDNGEARYLRARASRRAGEHQSAIEDLNTLLKKDPANRAAVVERMLAAYQLHVLYPGNLNEPLLRPVEWDDVRADVETLGRSGSDDEKYAAQVVEALAKQDYGRAAELAEKIWPSFGQDRLTDWSMLQGDALFHAAEQAFTEEQAAPEAETKEARHKRREDLARRARQTVQRGLDVDAYHVGLLFLRADGVLRHAVWTAGENEDRETALRRHKTAFETACGRLSRATLRAGGDTHLARAVLLCNAGRDESALEQLADAINCRPAPPNALMLQAYLRLQAPPDGQLSAKEADRILIDLRPAFENPPDDFNTWFVRALAQTAAGNWDEARRDLRECRKKLGKDDLPTSVPAYAEWFHHTEGPGLEYLHATFDVLAGLAVPVDLRVRLGEEMLKRLADEEGVKQDGLEAEQAQQLRGQTHLYLARAGADGGKKDDVLKHLRAALELKLADLTPETLRADDSFKPWNEDADFVALYKQYTPPPSP